MTQLEDDLRAVLRAREHDIDASSTRSYASTVQAGRSRALWPVLGAGAVVAVVAVVAAVTWPAADPDVQHGAGVPTSPAASPAPTASGSGVEDVVVGGDPARLIGRWAVTGTSETEPVTLTLTGWEVQVSRPCGSQDGQWRASASGLFVADTSSWDPACEDGRLAPAWLTAASAYALAQDLVSLVDHEGQVVATLVNEDRPTSTEPDIPFGASALVLPERLEAATPDRLVGRWTAGPDEGPSGEGDAPTEPFAQFAPDGTWTGSDGCNGQGGRWVADEHGELLATQGPQTLIGCRGVSIGGWLQDAVAAGFDGEVLVLLDTAGHEVGRLQRG